MSITKSAVGESHAPKRRKLSHCLPENQSNGGTSSPPTPNKSFVMENLTKELLAEVQPDYEVHASRLEPTFQRLSSIIEKAPVRKPLPVTEAEKFMRKSSGLTIPFSEPKPGKDTQYLFEFQPPGSAVFPTGPWSKLYLKGQRDIDAVVTMPATLFQMKDYLNYRALHKRAFYLSCVAAAVDTAGPGEFNLEYECLDDIACLPALVVTPTEKSPADFMRSKCRIRIQVAFPRDAVPVEKTLPTKNCIRPLGGAAAEDILNVTPFYNSLMQATVSGQFRQTMLDKALESCPSLADACRLGGVWLRQRNLGSPMSNGGFGPHEWNLLCAILLKSGGHKGRPTLSTRFSALQIFKAVLHFLAERDLREPLLVNSEGLKLEKSNIPVVYEGTLGYNILFKMNPSSYEILKSMAAQSVTLINKGGPDVFEATFIARIDDSFLRFDEILKIDSSKFNIPASESVKYHDLSLELYSTLSRGFGDRINGLHIQLSKTPSWKIKKPSLLDTQQAGQIVVLLLLNPETTTGLVDHGPTAEEVEAAADFRQFWGSRAELRRFKDGTICESLIWSAGSSVNLQIAQHLLQYRFGVPIESITTTSEPNNNLESQMLPPPPLNLTISDSFHLIHKTFQDLTNILLQIKNLPLRIKSTAGLDAALSSSSLELLSTRPINIQIVFEDSPRWPDTLPAIEHTKTAFLIKLADALDESHPHLTTRVGVENQARTPTSKTLNDQYSYLFNRSFLDIIYPSPLPSIPRFIFRIRIYNPRTTLLFKSLLNSPPQKVTTKKPPRALLTSALTHSTLPVHLATHNLALRALSSTYPSLSATIRLLTAWTASHLLTPHVPPQLIALVGVAALTGASPAPGTCTTGFLRALACLAKWDWLAAPLAVSLGAPLTPEQRDDIAQAFTTWRVKDPAMHRVAVVAGSNLDLTGALWTLQQAPGAPANVDGPATARGVSAVIMKRWCRLAQHSLSVVAGWHQHAAVQPWDWRGEVFSSPLGDYDFLVHLKRHLVKKPKAAEAKFKNLALAASGALDEGAVEDMGFDAVRLYLDDLETSFGSAVLFFWDGSGKGRVIAGLWKPDVLGRKKVGTGDIGVGFTYPVLPVEVEEGEEEVVINQASILVQISALGDGMVEQVEKINEFIA